MTHNDSRVIRGTNTALDAIVSLIHISIRGWARCRDWIEKNYATAIMKFNRCMLNIRDIMVRYICSDVPSGGCRIRNLEYDLEFLGSCSGVRSKMPLKFFVRRKSHAGIFSQNHEIWVKLAQFHPENTLCIVYTICIKSGLQVNQEKSTFPTFSTWTVQILETWPAHTLSWLAGCKPKK